MRQKLERIVCSAQIRSRRKPLFTANVKIKKAPKSKKDIMSIGEIDVEGDKIELQVTKQENGKFAVYIAGSSSWADGLSKDFKTQSDAEKLVKSFQSKITMDEMDNIVKKHFKRTGH